jgi:hypothetical protein
MEYGAEGLARDDVCRTDMEAESGSRKDKNCLVKIQKAKSNATTNIEI